MIIRAPQKTGCQSHNHEVVRVEALQIIGLSRQPSVANGQRAELTRYPAHHFPAAAARLTFRTLGRCVRALRSLPAIITVQRAIRCPHQSWRERTSRGFLISQ